MDKTETKGESYLTQSHVLHGVIRRAHDKAARVGEGRTGGRCSLGGVEWGFLQRKGGDFKTEKKKKREERGNEEKDKTSTETVKLSVARV